MEKKIMAAATVVATAAAVMFALGGCAESSVGENVASLDVGASDSVGVVMANDETEETTENVTGEVTESVTDEAAVETEELKSVSVRFARKLEDESLTLTIDNENFPYDCEEIEIDVDTEIARYIEVKTYQYIDLGNLKYYPDLKRLIITDDNAQGSAFIKLINGGSAAGLENLEEITLKKVVWDEDWLSGISSLKKLSIASCRSYEGEYLENLSQVETLSIYRCPITDLSFINGMSSLTELTMDQTKLNNSGFDGVEENYSVKRLTLCENGASYALGDGEYGYTLTDITGVSKLRGLEYLYAAETHLVDLEQQRQEVQASLPECEVKIYSLN